MMARAASAPWSAASALTAAGRPPRIFWMSSATPITPVEETSTCSTGHLIARAVSAAMSRATCIPSSPVQALAQPLFTTIARATPPDFFR